MRTRLAWLFPRASERRVFLKWRSAIHPYIFILTSSHAHIFTSSHPHLLTSSISFFSSSHLHLFISSHHRQNLNLHVLTSPRHILKSSYHNIFFSSHPHLFTSSISFFSSYIFISSYLHTLYIIFYIFFSEISWYISLFMLHAIPSSDLHISLHLSSLSGHPSSSFSGKHSSTRFHQLFLSSSPNNSLRLDMAPTRQMWDQTFGGETLEERPGLVVVSQEDISPLQKRGERWGWNWERRGWNLIWMICDLLFRTW